ncbi:MAG: PAS domain S-box protein [Chloroflexi bacterium]|nr:PAS domain S-box protein [Chloroflexota bacterium]
MQSGSSGSENQYHSLFENMLDGFAYCEMLFDKSGQPLDFIYLDVNRAFGELTGLMDVIGKKVSEVIPGIRASNPKLFEIYGRVALSGKPEKFETYLDSLKMWLSISVYSPQKGSFVAVFDNITERRQAEKRIMRLNRLYATLSQINQTIVRVHEPKVLYEEICRAAVEHGQFYMAWIGFNDETNGLVKPAAFAGEERGYLENISVKYQDESLGRGPIGTAIREGCCTICQDIANDPRMEPWRGEALGRGFRSLAAVPIRQQGRAIGALAVYSAETYGFQPEDENLLTEIGMDISFALDTIKSNEERRQAEAAYRTLVDHSLQGFLIMQDGRFVFANHAASVILGYEMKELLALSPGQIAGMIHPDDRALALERIRARLAGEVVPAQYEYRIIRKNGDMRWLDQYAVLIEYQGKPAIQLAAIDITERKQAEDTLMNREKRFRALIENGVDYISLLAADGSLLWENPSAVHMLDYAENQFLGRNILQLIHPDDLSWVQTKFANLVRTPGSQERASFRLRHRDGSWRWIEAVVTNLLNDPSVEAIVVNYHDITEHRQAEEKLRESEEKFRKTFMTSPDSININRLQDGMYVSINSGFTKTMGYTENDVLGKTSLDLNIWEDPGDRKKLAERLKESGQVYNFEARFRAKNGDIKYGLMAAAVIDLNGVPHIISMTHDITKRKENENKIEHQLQRLTALSEIDRVISSSFNLHSSLDALLSHATRLLHVDAAAVLLWNPVLQVLEYKAGQGFRTRAIQTAQVPLGENYAGRAALERRMVLISNLESRPDDLLLTKYMAGEGFAAYCGVPLITKGKVAGVLEVFHRAPLNPDSEWLDFLNTMAGQAAIAVDNTTLFENLRRTNTELTIAYDVTIEGWSHALDLRDEETEGHTLRVAEMVLELGKTFGMNDEALANVRRGALLHDIGKMGIPDKILLKPGELTDEEWSIMKKHPRLAYEMLAPIRYLKDSLDIPYCHHEKWDGTGYPRGLKGEQIPLSARLFSVVDVWDALTSDRPYRKAWSKEKTRQHIIESSGTHFDPVIVKAFLESGLMEKY